MKEKFVYCPDCGAKCSMPLSERCPVCGSRNKPPEEKQEDFVEKIKTISINSKATPTRRKND